jgi:hypothetical protein
MFKLIVALFLVTNGAPAETPSQVMTYNHSAFDTQAACMEFFGTDNGRAVDVAFSLIARQQGVAVKFACVEAKDNSI